MGNRWDEIEIAIRTAYPYAKQMGELGQMRTGSDKTAEAYTVAESHIAVGRVNSSARFRHKRNKGRRKRIVAVDSAQARELTNIQLNEYVVN